MRMPETTGEWMDLFKHIWMNDEEFFTRRIGMGDSIVGLAVTNDEEPCILIQRRAHNAPLGTPLEGDGPTQTAFDTQRLVFAEKEHCIDVFCVMLKTPEKRDQYMAQMEEMMQQVKKFNARMDEITHAWRQDVKLTVSAIESMEK